MPRRNLLAKLTEVAQTIGAVQVDGFRRRPGRPDRRRLSKWTTCTVHVWPSNSMADFDFGAAQQNPDPAVLDANAEKLRAGAPATRARGVRPGS